MYIKKRGMKQSVKQGDIGNKAEIEAAKQEIEKGINIKEKRKKNEEKRK
jgi:hypothetical protein